MNENIEKYVKEFEILCLSNGMAKEEIYLYQTFLTSTLSAFEKSVRTAQREEDIAVIEGKGKEHGYWDGYFLGGEDSPETKLMNKARKETIEHIVKTLKSLPPQ